MQIDNQYAQQTDSIPPEMQDILDELTAAKMAKIESIGKRVAKLRDNAVKGRKASGVERLWAEDEEYYQGVDDANRDTAHWLKSASANAGGISRSRSDAEGGGRCQAFFNITAPTVDSAAARMGDILLPAGDRNWLMTASPVQDTDECQTCQVGGQPPATATEQPVTDAPTAPQGMIGLSAPLPATAQPTVPAPVDPAGTKPIDPRQQEADAKAEKASAKIHDWLVECSYHTEVRKVIEDAAKLGTGVIKGAVPQKRSSRKTSQQGGTVTQEIVEEVVPVSKHVDLWDFFPDPSCGENIHDGNYCLERDRLTARQLKDLKGVPGYLSDQIDKVLDEGVGKKYYDDGQRTTEDVTQDDEKFEVWYFNGLIDIGGLSAMGVEITDDESKRDVLPAVVTMVNDTPIKAHINPLDTGEFPYDVMVWNRKPGTWTGVGIARLCRTAQDMLNASCRALMDNAGLSSAPMIIIRQNAIRPADGKWNISARKIWLATEEADVRSVSDAIMAIHIPMVQQELQAIIELAHKMVEDTTGITYLMQGQQGAAPDTVGGMELLHRNASTVLRRTARIFDERITEPHIRRYYDYLLMMPGNDDCKGDLKIEAIGSTALVEREIQGQQSMQLLNLSVNAVFGLDPEAAMTEVLKAMRFNPEKWQLSDAKKAAAQNQQPPMAPAVQAAQINAQSREKIIQLQLAQQSTQHQADVQEGHWEHQVTTNSDIFQTQHKLDRDIEFEKILRDREIIAAQERREEILLKRELAMLQYANQRNISLDQIKADLAKEAMRLKTQKELAFADNTQPDKKWAEPHQVAVAGVEPVGRANYGHAFEG